MPATAVKPSAAPAKNKSGWRRVKFGDVVECVNDTEADPQAAGIERVVGLDHLDPGSLHIKRWANIEDGTTFTRRFKSGQVLFGKRRAYQRKLAVAEFDGICSGDILVFEPKNDDLIPELLPFIMQAESFWQHALDTSAGSLSPRTKWQDLARYEFALPPKEEQRRIAAMLWAADDTEQKWISALERVEVLKQSVSHDYFSTESEGQRVVKCEDLGEITVGIVVTPAKFYVPDGVPTLRSLNVFPDRFDLSELVSPVSASTRRIPSSSRWASGSKN